MGFYDDIDSEVHDTGMWWGARTFVDAPIDSGGINMNADVLLLETLVAQGTEIRNACSRVTPEKQADARYSSISVLVPCYSAPCKHIHLKHAELPFSHTRRTRLGGLSAHPMHSPNPRRNLTPKSISP